MAGRAGETLKRTQVFSLSDRVEYAQPTWRTWGGEQILRKRLWIADKCELPIAH